MTACSACTSDLSQRTLEQSQLFINALGNVHLFRDFTLSLDAV